MKRYLITVILCLGLGLAAGYHLASNRDAQPSAGKGPQTTAARKAAQRKIAYYKDPMHPWYTSDKPGKAPDCGMDLVPVYEDEAATPGVVRIDPLVVQNIGVRTEEVTLHRMKRVVRAPGIIQPDETRTFAINTKFSGWVEKLYADYTGMPVRKGQALMELYSPELVTAQEEYLQALAYRDRLQATDSGTEVLSSAERLVSSARSRLLNWDVPPGQIATLERNRTPSRTLSFHSPASGIILQKNVQDGQRVTSGFELYRVADLSKVWVMAEVYQYELAWVSPGQTAWVEVSYLPGRVFQGKVAYVYPELDSQTRSARLRVELPNSPDLELKPGMYVSVRLESSTPDSCVAVPEQAIIRSGERNIAVMARGGGYFEPREVKLGLSAEGYVQVLEGLRAGENIVVSAQFLIDSESNLRAAVGQMTGHTGMGMPKPTPGVEEQKPDSTSKPDDMSGMQMKAPDSARKTVTAQGGPHEEHSSAKADTFPPGVQLYTCTMHPQVLTDKPGKCPICGMTLIPVKKP